MNMYPLYFTGYDNKARPFDRSHAGTVRFLERETRLIRIPGGAMLRLAYCFNLSPGLYLSMSSITAEIWFGVGQLSFYLGVATDPQSYVINTDHQFIGGPETIIKGTLQIALSLAAIEAVESRRSGGPAEFGIVLHGSVFVNDQVAGKFDVCRVQVAGSSDTPVHFQANRDLWSQQVRDVSPIGSVLVEIPLAFAREGPWQIVWTHMDAATASLAHGGETGFKNCVTEVRQAIAAWRNIEKPQVETMKRETKQDRRERLLNIASMLMHYCSTAAHGEEHPIQWTRADAIMALSTLCALLSARDP